MDRVFTAQIDSMTSCVVATNESDNGLGPAPLGRVFVVYDPEAIGNPTGKFYVNGQFIDDLPI